MPSHTKPVSNAALPRVPAPLSPAQQVRKYTDYLLKEHNRYYALECLLFLDCPIRVFRECRTEQIVKSQYDGRYEYQYPVNLLLQKLRRLAAQELEQDVVEQKMREASKNKVLFANVLNIFADLQKEAENFSKVSFCCYFKILLRTF